MESISQDDEYRDFVKKFEGLATQINQLAKQAVKPFANEVTAILQTQSTDCQQIEQLLDRMLDFCFDAEVLFWFKKLCRYYYGINPESTADYIMSYREMWDSENNNDK